MTTICICGAGTMGSGIAQVAATAGFSTLLFDVSEAAVQKAAGSIRDSLRTLVQKGKLTEERSEAIWQQLVFVSDIAQCRADVVIEAIVEKPQAKVSLFSQLAAINGASTIFASNTSSLSVSAIAEKLPNPERVAGLHFFNPAPLMKLVEVVRGRQTSNTVVKQLVDLTRAFGKVPVVCKDSPGFIVNRVARPYYIESLRMAEEGKVTYEVIDRLLEGVGFKMGPFRLMDLIGNDINYAVSCSVYEQLGKPERLQPSYLQKEKVAKGELGKKTGKGYYPYPAPPPPKGGIG
ncbi:MAG TPA: 3-hydroxyacyl-CoA dehydrogenase NAD-binding domain-containing protein [Flavisolibacter sp.]|nr:3-hydroxyacyl-CoA dehydrogenase NAD-binding domain-containing protein [Flavisolibacter sp.]